MDYGALIVELRGEYIDLEYFTSKCTHLVVGKASRTEKYLGACATGKWVLHKSYLEACRAANKFVEEEPHEWGVKMVGEGRAQPLEVAPRMWRLALAKRKELNASEVGAFHGWKVLLFADRAKLSGLKRLLETGGGQVLNSSGKLEQQHLKEVTHAFINMNNFPKDLSLEEMVRRGVHCLRPDYIAEYIAKGSDVTIENSYIAEAKTILQASR